jgi:hypothetical protein
VPQGIKDGVLDFLSVTPGRIAFLLGVQFRDPRRARPNSLLTARYVRVQVASPPPSRVDGTAWAKGLVVRGDGPFDPDNPPAHAPVLPVDGIAPLGQPDPETIVLDRWLAVPATPTKAPPQTFTMTAPDPKAGEPMSFLSVRYPDPRPEGVPLAEAAVDYHNEVDIDLDREINIAVHGVWIAVSLDRFFPPERASADYIVRVTPRG